LNLFGAPPLEVRLSFDQALNPSDVNVPVHFDSNPLVRDASQRGRIWLEYEDTAIGVGVFTWIPADFALEQNDLNGAVAVLRPIGVLPNNASVRIVVDPALEDICGESNVADPSYGATFGEFRTDASYAQQWNGIAEDFATADHIDFGAAFPEAQAEVHQGYVRAGFAFEGNATSLEYEPLTAEIVLNTAFTQITPKTGLPFTVSGGVFHFKNVKIPSGVHVQGLGPNPMVWLCSGDFTVDGTLSVRGGRGARTESIGAANIAKAGGIGACGGGNGGEGTPSATLRDQRGGAGRGPMQVPGIGGRGGYLACSSACFAGSGGGGSGGGGGTLATQGDPGYRGAVPPVIVPNVAPTANTSFQQLRGYGGSGCTGASGARVVFLQGGEPGDLVFTDSRADNDFWGSGIRLRPTGNLRITGELTLPVGGGGGGGGGDTAYPLYDCTATSDPTWDRSGGGGGGGGGVLIVKALGTITVGATGRITADGGDGGGGEPMGLCNWAGGGGGGAGGMVVLMAARQIVLNVHGSATANRFTYAEDDYDFCISADGGACTTTGATGPLTAGKYPASGASMVAGVAYDSRPIGGFGGMGIVQLMVPPGDNTVDGTNTCLDDNVVVLRPTASGGAVVLAGLEKQAMLAWRGFADGGGQFVDDLGTPTGIGTNEGDIRPTPILLPVPFSSKSRLRSKWIDTGCSRRRELAAPDGLPAGIVGAPPGPICEFAGIDTAGASSGYVDYRSDAGTVEVDYPLRFGPAVVAGRDASASYLGAHAYRVSLANAALGAADRYVQHEAELLDATGGVLGSFRILHHSDTELWLDPNSGVLPSQPARLQIRAKFFRVSVAGTEGLGPVYSPQGGNQQIPQANVRIGFAFHQDPQAATGRFPVDDQQYLHDLEDPDFLHWVAVHGAPRYVQWDLVFDLAFADQSVAPSLSPTSPRLELSFLRLPFRF
jgi:hypothetical protein